jgi:hypothetical protein
MGELAAMLVFLGMLSAYGFTLAAAACASQPKTWEFRTSVAILVASYAAIAVGAAILIYGRLVGVP